MFRLKYFFYIYKAIQFVLKIISSQKFRGIASCKIMIFWKVKSTKLKYYFYFLLITNKNILVVFALFRKESKTGNHQSYFHIF